MTKQSSTKLAFALAILLVLLLVAVLLQAPLRQRRVVLTTDSQGNACIAGIPMRNPQFREGVLKTLHGFGFEMRLWIGVHLTNSTQVSNLFGTLAAVDRYSPPRTNINTGPSPYE